MYTLLSSQWCECRASAFSCLWGTQQRPRYWSRPTCVGWDTQRTSEPLWPHKFSMQTCGELAWSLCIASEYTYGSWQSTPYFVLVFCAWECERRHLTKISLGKISVKEEKEAKEKGKCISLFWVVSSSSWCDLRLIYTTPTTFKHPLG